MKDYVNTQVSSEEQIHQILALQRVNTKSALSAEAIEKEGFVTCEHEFPLLKKMNEPQPHIISLYEDKVVGYCLVMSPVWRNELEVLKSMFRRIEEEKWNGVIITGQDYITMGQVCIAKDHRGKGLFRKMYDHFKQCLSPYYKYCITEVATSNYRSRNAHAAVGFQTLLSYKADDGNSWELIIWDWNR